MMKEKDNIFLRFYAYFFYLVLFAPLVIVVLASFCPGKGFSPGKEFSLDAYIRLIQNGNILPALERSLRLAAIAALVSTTAGVMAAVAFFRGGFPGRPLVGAMVLIPLAVPEIILGTMLLSFFYSEKITLGFYTVLVAHILFCTPFVIIVARSRLANYYDRSMEEAALDLGADEADVLRKITIPLVAPCVLTGLALSFALSFNNFVVTFLCSGVGSTTLPLKFYSLWKLGERGEINVIATMMIYATLILAIFSERFALHDSALAKMQRDE